LVLDNLKHKRILKAAPLVEMPRTGKTKAVRVRQQRGGLENSSLLPVSLFPVSTLVALSQFSGNCYLRVLIIIKIAD